MSLVIDIAIFVLLIGTLAYAWFVERRVRILMQALRDLEPMIGDFSHAVDRSQSAVSMLKTLGQSVQAPFAARKAPPAEPAPQPAPDAAFHTNRDRPARSSGVTGIPVKSELVRGFFETVKSREA